MTKKNLLFRLAFLAVLCAFCATGAALLHKAAEARDAGSFYARLRMDAAMGQAVRTPPRPSPPQSPLPARRTALPPLCAAVAALREDWPDTAAWLRLPGTAIDYPVMRAGDNAYYLDKLPDGTRNAAGSLFLDCRSTAESQNLVIYGHNAGGAMFGSLRRYRDAAYYREHPAFFLATADAEYVLRIFSVRLADAYGDAYNMDFESTEAFSAYCTAAAESSLYPAGEGPAEGERIVTLSTCTGRERAERLVVQAVLAPAGP